MRQLVQKMFLTSWNKTCHKLYLRGYLFAKINAKLMLQGWRGCRINDIFSMVYNIIEWDGIRIRIGLAPWIRIRIEVKSWIRIRNGFTALLSTRKITVPKTLLSAFSSEMFEYRECIVNSIKIIFLNFFLIFVPCCAGSPVTCVSILAEEVRGKF